MATQMIHGMYGDAVIYTTNGKNAVDDYAIAQIQRICDNEVAKNSSIRVMPDVHPGKVGTIGLTMTLRDRVLPELTGVDAGCGLTLTKIKKAKPEFLQLDKVIRETIPSGFRNHKIPHRRIDEVPLDDLFCARAIRREKVACSLGTLGGGNHFIELDFDEDGSLWLAIHSGSRILGQTFTEFYLTQGQRALKNKGMDVPYEMTWIDGELFERYLHDIAIVQAFASLNRRVMTDEILKGMKWKAVDQIECIHNNIDDENGIVMLRKGAISAKTGQTVAIPINMRDGILLGTGLGNPDWNCSAPHGAGRIIKREDVASRYTVSQFKSVMHGIYSPSIDKSTLDEAPFCYRQIDEMRDAVQASVKIDRILKPVYNFKAGKEA